MHYVAFFLNVIYFLTRMAVTDCVGEELGFSCFRLCRGICAAPRLSISERSLEGFTSVPPTQSAPQPAAHVQSDVNNTSMNMGVRVSL